MRPQFQIGKKERRFARRLFFKNEELKAELERLNEIDAPKKGTSTVIPMKKGCSLNLRLEGFPVTLYKEQWIKVADMSANICASSPRTKRT
jgi:hypothetical protein